MTILSLDAFQFSSRDLASGYRFLQDLFKHEFSFDLEKSPEFFLRRSIKSFIDDAVLMPHPTLPDTYNITSAGLRTLRVFAHFCRPFLEAYSVVVDYLEQHAAEGLSAGEHLKGIGSHGNRMFKRKDVGLKESLSRITFQNALAFFNARGIFGREDNTAISSYGAQIRRYLERFQT
jgi:glycerol-3-phosphate O-acyltransferase